MVIPSDQLIELFAKVSESFSPSAPIDQRALFAGRLDQIADVATAISQRGQHVVLFGERGVGKTSLATVISQMYKSNGTNLLSSGSINCDETTTFSNLWHKALREMPVDLGESRVMGFLPQPSSPEIGTLAQFLPEDVTPDDIRHIFSRVGKSIVVIDELDRIEDKRTTKLLADTIKTLSDHSVDCTLVLVGVADSVDNLIEQHQSVERALVQIRMPRMNKGELMKIIETGAAKSGLTVQRQASEKIATLSQGLPHYTHLLALHSFQAALLRQSLSVELNDVSTAIQKALDRAQQSIISAHHQATNSPKQNLYPQVLLACAMAKTDGLGFFAAGDVREPMSQIMGKAYDIPAFAQHLKAFCEATRGPILQKSGEPRRYRFRFANPLMQPYVLMDGVRRGLITESQIA
ncbi:ATP-binding protein [Paraburkholderia sp. SIMBA_009]